MSKVGAVWADGTTVSTKLLQRPTNAVQGRDAVVAGWIEAIGEYLAQNSLELGAGQQRRPRDPRPVPALRRAGPLGEHAGQLRGLGLQQRLQPGAGEEGRPRDAAGGGQRRRLRRRRRGAARARNGHGRRADARARFGPRHRVHRRARVAAAGRHAGGDGDRAHAGGAAPAGREAVHVRLRPDLGLRRAVHDARRPALPARREAAVVSRPPAGDGDGDAEGEGAGAARAGAEGRRAGRRAVRLPGARDGPSHREPGAGAGSRVRRHRRRPDGSREHHRRVSRALSGSRARDGARRTCGRCSASA